MSDDEKSPDEDRSSADNPQSDNPQSDNPHPEDPSAANPGDESSAQPREPDPPEDEYFTGERGRRIPRAALVVFGIALVVLLVFVFARPGWFTRDVGDHSLHVPSERHFVKSLAGAGREDGVWLTDDSPSSSFLVTFPADSPREETRVHLQGDTKVAEDSIVFLTVRMDGQQVFKEELPRGDNDLDEYIDVPDQIAADGQVRVQMRVDGDLTDQQCTADRSTGMQVHIAADSVAEAALSEPVHTVRDAVVSWDRDVTVVVPDQSDEWRTAAAQMGIALTQAGHDVTFSAAMPESDADDVLLAGPPAGLTDLGWTAPDQAEGALAVGTVDDTPVLAATEPDGSVLASFLTENPVATADSAATDPRSVPAAAPSGNEVGVAALGADTSVTDVMDTQNWRMRYSLTDLPGGRLPQAIRVALQLPATPDDLTWVMNTELNGQLLQSRRLTQSTGEAVVPLPAAAQLLNNDLTISVLRDRDLGGCDVRVTPYPMQLLPSSAVQMGNDPGAGFTALPRVLAPGFAVHVPDSVDADAITQLDAIVPVLATFVPSHYNPEFRWGAAPAPGQPYIVVGESPGVNTMVRIVDGRIEAGPATPALDITSFETGMVIQTATGPGDARGLSIQYAGAPGGMALPAFGRETAEVVTAQGSFAVNPDGSTVPSDQASAGSPG
ncbi:hypothetical protein V1Y59_12855 [Gordonia sp. PKS22-38]|uniref:Uncharacterized protein n=1 Tax=Gordonia prachuapensis TaxID=3115651 RepID=A0ABU7MUG1_9ACTN|nr:hypothetical protein [Gordonia sp. PKS22-38]